MNINYLFRLTAAASLLAVSACASITNQPSMWGLMVEQDAGGCPTNMSYSWGDSSMINGRGYTRAKFCGTGELVLTESVAPTGPLEVQWTNAKDERIRKSLDMAAVLKGHQLYGGYLTITIKARSVQVWLAEPDKSRYDAMGVYPRKPNKLIFETE